MLNMIIRCFIFLALFSNLGAAEEKAEEKNSVKVDSCKEELVESFHSIKIKGQQVNYKATTGTLVLKNDKEEPKAKIFFVAYTKENSQSIDRPITFCFNGGPGCSSVWLHLGVFGPKRVLLTDNGYAVPPYQLVDNEYSLLDSTDLVFIDPVSTGHSRSAPGEDPKQFFGVEEDVKSVAEFIRLYTTRFSRWDSPKFLAGESYGGIRAAGLAKYLHDSSMMYVNGIMFISSVLNFETIDFDQSDLTYELFLPSYTATAWYHKKLSSDLQSDFNKALKESEDFAMTEYPLALLKGDEISAEEKKRIVQKLSRLTGLSSEYIDQSNLRVPMFRFSKELLRNDRRTIGRFDSRFLGIDSDSAGECFQYDPSLDAIAGAFTATLNQYLSKDLKWCKDDEYNIIADVRPWNYGMASNQYLNLSNSVREVMTKNPLLQVFVATGYYDLGISYYGAKYSFSHLGLDPILRSHIHISNYESGHMMYIHKPSLIKLSDDLKQFIKLTLEEKDLVINK